MNHIVFQSKCQGYSHIKSDLECQDSTLVKKTEKYAIAVVADGHGSASYFRSSRGSLFAKSCWKPFCLTKATWMIFAHL